MEGFETIDNVPATLQDLAKQGYTSKQRGGAVHPRKGTCVNEVQVVRGFDLPPCVLASWTKTATPGKTHTGTRTFTTDEQLEQWLKEWDVRLGRHTRRLLQS